VRIIPAQLSDAILIAVVGAAVAAGPAVWTPLVWPDVGGVGSGGDRWIFAFSIGPFILLGFLRAIGVMHRPVTLATGVIVVLLVVLGQEAGLDPNDPSSTASIALVTVPVFACVVVLAALFVDLIVVAIVTFRRLRQPFA
jgi:hypothetical protein